MGSVADNPLEGQDPLTIARTRFPDALRAFPYHDRHGRIVDIKIRLNVPSDSSDKCRWAHLDGQGGLVLGRAVGVEVEPLYGYAKVKALGPGQDLYICEGERDCDTLWKRGIAAVCSPHGASKVNVKVKWWDEHTKAVKALQPHSVTVVADPDEQGLYSAELGPAQQLAQLDLFPIFRAVPPNEHDLTEHLEQGGVLDQLKFVPKFVWDGAPEAGGYGETTGSRPGQPHRLSDLGNAERMVDLFGGDFRWVNRWNKWIVWDGKRWAMDGNIRLLAQRTARSIYAEASRVPGGGDEAKAQRTAITKWALASERASAIDGMIKEAKGRPEIYLQDGEVFDTHPWLFNCDNGTLNLRGAQPRLRGYRRDDLLTMVSPVTYDPTARCPRWEQFIDEITLGRKSLAEHLQRLAGATLVGVVRDHHLPVLWGSGGNGKTVFCETVGYVLGDYAQTLPVETLLVKYGGNSIPNDIARMRGARLILAAEPDENRKLNESLVKQLTGGDTVTARFMRGEWFEFAPTWDLWLRTNHKPVIKGTDEGIWRRIALEPFEASFPEDKQDKQLGDKLRDEAPGILNWMLVGNAKWQDDGLAPPDEVTDASRAYREEQDLLGQVLVACCEKAEGGVLYVQDLVRLYREVNGVAISQKSAAEKMKRLRYEHNPRYYDSKQRKQRSAFLGIQLRKSAEEE